MKDYEKLDSLREIIKFKKAIDAVCHVIERVRKFNEEYYPFKIKLIGIGGSSVRTETPRDIDIYIEASTVPGVWQEWLDFQHKLSENINVLANILWNARKCKKRITINDIIIGDARKELLKQGFEERQLDLWFKWLRISDIQFGLDRGLPIVTFTNEKLIARFISAGWKGRRLEIHPSIFDAEQKIWVSRYDIPHLTVWKIEKGIVIPSKDEINIFNQREYERLSKLANSILKLIYSKKNDIDYQVVPTVYYQAIWLMRNHNNKTRFANFRNELKMLLSHEVENIKKSLNKKIVTPEDNTELRNSLKRFALIGKIDEKINALEYNIIYTVFKTDDPKISLTEILSKRLRRDGFWKKDIMSVLNAVDINKLRVSLQKCDKENCISSENIGRKTCKEISK